MPHGRRWIYIPVVIGSIGCSDGLAVTEPDGSLETRVTAIPFSAAAIEFTPDGIPIVDEAGVITSRSTSIQSAFYSVTHHTAVSIPASVSHEATGTIQEGVAIPLPLNHTRAGLSWPWDPYYDTWNPPVNCYSWPNAAGLLSTEHKAYWFIPQIGLELDTKQSADSYACQTDPVYKCPGLGVIAPIYDANGCNVQNNDDGSIIPDGEDGDCYTQYIVVEVSYDGGNTWSEYWSGYATVCD